MACPARFDFAVHNAWAQAWQEVGNDPDNEVLIITGTGKQWLGTPRPSPPIQRKWPTGSCKACAVGAVSASF